MSKLTIGEVTYNLDEFKYIHLYNFIAMLGWQKKIGFVKDPTKDLLKPGNYDWVLVFDEVDNRIYGGNQEESEELLANRKLFDQVEKYLEQHPEKFILTCGNGACGWVTKKVSD